MMGRVGRDEIGHAVGTRAEPMSKAQNTFRYQGKPLKDFEQENDMMECMSCGSHSSSFVDRTIGAQV